MTPLTEYEIQRQKNIAANIAILASLGLEKPAPAVFRPKIAKNPKPRPKYEPKALPKRKAVEAEIVEEEPETGRRRKSARLVAAVSIKLFNMAFENNILLCLRKLTHGIGKEKGKKRRSG